MAKAHSLGLQQFGDDLVEKSWDVVDEERASDVRRRQVFPLYLCDELRNELISSLSE
jgi:hypothetical protein